ncbi:MAG: hypothetical protein IAE66_06220 [Xanthomonadaceae bacterium]|nr:hypothetical protein [Xanthomonadaceae bacterium]
MATKSVAEDDEFTLLTQLSTPDNIIDVKFSDRCLESDSFAAIGIRLADAASDLFNVSKDAHWESGVPEPGNMQFGIEFLMRCSSMFTRLAVEAAAKRAEA